MKAIQTSRRQFMRTTLGIAAGGYVSFPSIISTADLTQKPNIILILNDDHGWGDSGCLGHPVIQRAGIDKLTKVGCTFTDFTTCFPICSPLQ